MASLAILMGSPGGRSLAVAEDFKDIGFLPEGVLSYTYGMSADGLVLIGYGRSSGDVYEAFRWTQTGGMQGLGFMAGGTYSVGLGASADGLVVVGYGDSSTGQPTEAFRWTQAGGMEPLGYQAGGIHSYAFAASADGSVIVGYGSSSSSGTEAFRWTEAGGMESLGFQSGGSYSAAFGVSADGSVVIGYGNSSNSTAEAFRWTEAGGMAGLGFQSGGTRTQAYGVSADGTIVVGYGNSSSSGTEAFRWTQAGGMESLGFLPGGTTSRAYAVSGDGTAVVGYGDSSCSCQEAFMWTQTGGMQSIRVMLVTAGIDMTGWQLTDARAVSESGSSVAGSGINPDGQTEAWVARFGPETGVTTLGSVQQSVNGTGEDRFGLLTQQHGFAVPLLGLDKPMGSSSEAGVYASAGSAAAGGFIRYATGTGINVLAGLAYAQEDYPDAELKHSGMGALAVQYIAPVSGWWRPFVEGGGWAAPDAALAFERTYVNGAGTATGVGHTKGDLGYLYARAGLALALGATDQLVVSAELGREWLSVDAYGETASAQNPFAAQVSEGTDRADLAKLSVRYSHAITKRIDTTVWVAGVYAFNRESALEAAVPGIGTLAPAGLADLGWLEYGVRVGYGLTETVTVDAFANGVSGEAQVDTRIHGGLGLRYRY